MSILQALHKAQEDKKLVSLYINPDDWDQYSVGYIDLITETHVRLRTVSKFGAPAGFEIRSLNGIFKIEFDGKYEKKVEKLIASQNNLFKEVEPKKESSGNIILDTLKQSLEDSIIIVVWGSDTEDALVGYVESIKDDVASMRLVDEFGDDDGVSIIEIDQITDIDFNTQSEQVRNFLYNN